MKTLTPKTIQQLKTVIANGGIIAYPTEGVYGLGCDPFNETAVRKLAKLKGRSIDKGLILIAANWAQINNLIFPLDQKKLQRVKNTWPGPTTWLFPASAQVPTWIRGQHDSIALRLTAHPIANAICQTLDQVIVSTSANRSTEPALTNATEVGQVFGDQIDLIIDGEIGNLQQATPIIDVLTGKKVRL